MTMEKQNESSQHVGQTTLIESLTSISAPSMETTAPRGLAVVSIVGVFLLCCKRIAQGFANVETKIDQECTPSPWNVAVVFRTFLYSKYI